MPAPKRLALYPQEYRALLLLANNKPVHLTVTDADAKRLREDLYAFRTALSASLMHRDLELAIIAEGLRFSVKTIVGTDESILTIERKRDLGETIKEALANG